ncbi:ArsR/SmtB family transcription factor [Planctomicrobium sp. SH664]|uniref:ArsR/SmtB family transcription factor n=1 Tax=Planctomicrobium sp. SH664 TaxID=3448125 RepID=UPI003F5BDF2D
MITQIPQTASRQVEAPAAPEAETRVPELSQKLEKDLVQVFKLLADETRLKILFFLGREKELHVSALCERLGQSQPAVSHHLALLRVAGLIEPRRDGKHNFYSIQQGRFHELMGELFTSFTEDSNSNELRFEDFIFRHNREEEAGA